MWGGQIKKMHGFVTLLFTMVILASITAFAFVSAQSVVTQQRTVMSSHNNQSAFNIAQAGLDYAIPYLNANYSTIVNGSSQQMDMPGGGYATVQFAFVGDKDTIRVTSTGYSADNISSSSMQQLVKYQSGSSTKTFSQPVIARSGLAMTGTSTYSSVIAGNSSNLTTARLGVNSVSLGTYTSTTLSGVVISKPGVIGSDIIIDPSIFSGQSDAQLESTMLGQTIDQFSTVTTQSNVNVAGAPMSTHSTTTSGGSTTTVPVRQVNQAYFTPYTAAGKTSMTITSGTDIDLGYSGGALTLGTAAKPIVLEVVLVNPAPSSGIPLTAKILNSSKIYGDIVVRGGNVEIDTNANIIGNVIVQNGTAIIKKYFGYVGTSAGNVNGAVIAKGNVTLTSGSANGLIYTDGNLTMSTASGGSRAAVSGAIYTGGKLTMSSSLLSYNASLAKITTAGTAGATSGYGKVAGSWSDI